MTPAASSPGPSLGLKADEYERIREILGRRPTGAGASRCTRSCGASTAPTSPPRCTCASSARSPRRRPSARCSRASARTPASSTSARATP
ncbi:hypothetical protein [Nocardioides convexus]|uniref:hypothetical protein n=1 Tax=Nocardioides convexus TaxID=2712224 RepID=UPI0024184CD9|nr:hypothetical protein [Nocardioides convexus]